MFLPTWVELTPARKRLLALLSNGKWHRKFPGIGIKTFDLMDELGFIRKRHIDKKPWETENWTVEARITLKGRFLLKRGQCNLRYEHNPKARDLRTISVVEMER